MHRSFKLIITTHKLINDLMYFSFQPENLLYATDTDDSVLKLADFGLSKMLTTDILWYVEG